ncbi:hypothetical protein [Haloarcula pelagica]|uniref:hypothetical protein n=1 Tax=Haloarcula pelagica TaxID=3033389 RepID=UPI0024C2C55B|nr:hypothetical protein [Halomicroarcula sp. YJ-61-S]
MRGGLLDLEIVGEVAHLSPDKTVGLVATNDPDRFPESLLVDPERLERALIAVREEFDNPRGVNLALVQGSTDDKPDLALYADDRRDQAVVIAPRLRSRDDGGLEEASVETIETEATDD